EAEMMIRYNSEGIDGKKCCLSRIHVTGGTNGILINSLREFRPFTPSFFQRAEDQAYLFSTFNRPGKILSYVHKDGLIMRHDKEGFAREAIDAASAGKLVGDYIRILQFSTYAGEISEDINHVKDICDPFTGCFISKIPATIVLLRFALRAGWYFAKGENNKGVELLQNGSRRIKETMGFVYGPESKMKQELALEKKSWNIFYDSLDSLEKAISAQEEFALNLAQKARRCIEKCKLN
ncbi:hypothetical protein ACFL35_20650, partial [Candidatus Riflebacteria bacterium]